MIKYKYLIARRIVQLSLMLFYFGANAWGWNIIIGNLSSSLIFGTIAMSDPYAVLQMFIAGATIANEVFAGVLIVVLFYGIIAGRAFCSWVCPVNMITDLANFLRRKLRFNEIEKKQPASRNIRYYVILVSLIISFAFGYAAFEFISPVSMVHRGIIFGLGFGWAAIVVIFLFDLFILKNGWCGYICPIGGFYSIIGKFSLFRINHFKEKCTSCMKCKEVCPESQVLFMVSKSSQQVLNGECTNCGRCIEVCEDNALNFSIRKFIEQKNKENQYETNN